MVKVKKTANPRIWTASNRRKVAVKEAAIAVICQVLPWQAPKLGVRCCYCVQLHAQQMCLAFILKTGAPEGIEYRYLHLARRLHELGLH